MEPDSPSTDIDLLAPASGGMLIGYARVSIRDQKLARQIDALTAAGCSRIFQDKKSGKTADRPDLDAALDYARPGDTLVVTSLDRFSRSLHDLITMVAELRRRGIGFKTLRENLDTTTPGGRLIFHVFAALAEFLRELIVEGTREGLASAKARGRKGGRPPVMTPEKITAAIALLPTNSISAIARQIGVSRATLHSHLDTIRAKAIETNPNPQP